MHPLEAARGELVQANAAHEATATAAALRTESGGRLRALSLPARQLREWREEHAA